MSLDAMLRQYEKNDVSTRVNTKTDLNNYFTTFMKDGVNSKTFTIRLLPGAEGESSLAEVAIHTKQVEGKWQKYICPKAEKDEPCAMCEAREALLGQGTEEFKQLAKEYNAKKFYIAKVIDRDNEAHGPKFWRFAHNYSKTGVFDKIVGVLRMPKVGDITDPLVGRDLIVNVVRDAKGIPTVQSILPDMSTSPISDDAALQKEWLSDERTWENVYSIKSYEYLAIVVDGGVPQYDKEAKKFVNKLAIVEGGDTSDNEATFGELKVPDNVKPQYADALSTSSDANEVENDEEVDDLPF